MSNKATITTLIMLCKSIKNILIKTPTPITLPIFKDKIKDNNLK
jgi:hypothetical protein